MDRSLSKLQKTVKDREAGVMQSMGSQRVRHDLATEPHKVNNNKYVYFIYMYIHTNFMTTLYFFKKDILRMSICLIHLELNFVYGVKIGSTFKKFFFQMNS